jgi:hypothetical protein
MERYIALWIETMNPDIEKLGLTPGEIRNEIEEILNTEDIRLLTRKECSVNKNWQIQGEASLSICPRILKNVENKYVFRINMEFEQIAQPKHYSDIDSLSAVWRIQCGGNSSDLNDIRKLIKDGTRLFCSFYTLLNPEKTS